MNPIMSLIAGMGGTLIDRLFPDPEKRAAAQLELLKLTLDQANRAAADDLARDLAQARINEADANSGDSSRGGWRPGAGWVCVFGLGYQVLARPIVPWVVNAAGGHVPPLPEIDTETLVVLLTGLLGLGGMRMQEKLKGRA
jgi:hypothetical protein